MSRRSHVLAVFTAAFCLAPDPAAADLLLDPVGDTFGTPGSFRQDIISYRALTFPALGTTAFTVNFNNSVAPASAFANNSVLGFIDIDLDRNATTGGSAPWGQDLVGGNNWINNFINPPNPGTTPTVPVPGPLIALGDEDFVDLSSELYHAGMVDVISTATLATVATVPITYMAQGFTVTVPLVGTGNGSLNYGLLMGTYLEPTDRAPNGAGPAASEVVPEPRSLVLATGLLGVIGLVRAFRGRCGRVPDPV